MKVKTPISRSASALKESATPRTPHYHARQTDAATKKALPPWCHENNWKLALFESVSGAPRTGIVDAVMARIKPSKPDPIVVRLCNSGRVSRG
jgi:hypothetical protein